MWMSDIPRLAICRGVGGVGGSDTDAGCTETGSEVHDGVVVMRGHALRADEGEDVVVCGENEGGGGRAGVAEWMGHPELLDQKHNDR
jgi:hypothetical protein